MGFLFKRLLKKDHREKRLEFAKDNLKRDWDSVIFSDETTFQLFTYSKKVWRFGYLGKIRRKVKHPPKIHVWGCLTSSGFGKLYLFTHSLNGQLLIEIYKKTLLPSVKMHFGDLRNEWFLQEDNDPKHMSNIAKKWKLNHDVKRLNWPSMSPDLNPLENVWALLKAKVEEKNCKTIKQLKAKIIKEWKALPDDYAANLINSLPKRLLAVIANNGDYTLY